MVGMRLGGYGGDLEEGWCCGGVGVVVRLGIIIFFGPVVTLRYGFGVAI